MAKKKIYFTGYAEQTTNVLNGCGCLLVSGDSKEANVMTIGWGLIGMMWGKPVFVVAVRPSRHTFGFMEKTGEFTINVPKKGMEDVADYCGTVSGRDYDKFKEKGLTARSGKKIKCPIISECAVHYECKVIYKTEFKPSGIPTSIIRKYYPDGNFHTVYFGEIVAAYADEDAELNLP